MEEVEYNGLQNQLHEFFTQPISNCRRKEIEAALTIWQQDGNAWKKSITFLALTNDQYVQMFCLSTLEMFINKKWTSLSKCSKKEISDFLYMFSFEKTPQVTLKVVKLLVDTAKHESQDFFPVVLNLLRHENSAQLGLVYVLTISQEWGTPSHHSTFAKNIECQKLFLTQLPEVFSILLELLTSGKAEEFALLTVLNHLFSWVPAEYIRQSQPLVNAIFQIAVCTQEPDRAIIALGILNEILYRHGTPPCWQQYLQFVVSFLQAPSQNFDKRYLDKMCELLRLVLISHMSRGAENMTELLSFTLHWTEQQQTIHPGLTSCIRVWNGVLDHPNANKYGDELVKLASLLLHRIQWTQNNRLIVELDEGDEEFEEMAADETPWQRALRPCLEVVGRVAELRAQEVLNLVISQWVKFCQEIASTVFSNVEAEPLLRDVASLTRAVGQLSPFWREENASEFVCAVTSHLLALLRIPNHSMSDSIKIELIVTQCEALAALKACSMWLLRLSEAELSRCISEILAVTGEFLLESVPRKMQHSAAHLFSTLTATVRRPDSWLHPSIRPLFDVSLSYLQQEDGYLVTGGLLNCLILPTLKLDVVEPRLELANNFVERFSSPLSESCDTSVHIHTLQLMTHLISMYHGEGSKQKKIICLIFQKAAERALVLFRNAHNNANIARKVLELIQTLLECLQTQVGIGFVQDIVQTFLLSFSGEKLRQSLEGDDGGGLEVFLKILELVVSTPNMIAAGLTPMIVSLALQLADPMLKEDTTPVLQEPYFKLVYSILDHKWKYFEKGCVNSDRRVEEFLGLLRTMGGSLLLTDINMFSLNLNNFEKLNQHWRLYRTILFKNELLGQLLNVLLSTLLNKTHSLLADEITACVCQLIAADSDIFFDRILYTFISSVEGIEKTQRENVFVNFSHELDVPSLTKNIDRLINDLSCHRTQNTGQ